MEKLTKTIGIFEKKYDLKVVEVADYNNKYYLFTALKNPNEKSFDDPFYLVDKNTGEIKPGYRPMEDLEKFSAVLHGKQLKFSS